MSSGSADEGGEEDAESSHIYFEALRGQMKEILEVKKKGDNEVVVMPGAKHG